MQPHDFVVQPALALGGLPGAGPGFAGFVSWLIATVVVAVLAVLAWWTMRPAARATAALRPSTEGAACTPDC